MKRVEYILTALLTVAFVGLASTSCSSPDATERVDPDPTTDMSGPTRDQFTTVAPMLVRRCGSIDCHGSIYRNFRLYGFGGTRLSPTDTPDLPKTLEPAEIDADFAAVIGLEPELFRKVVDSGGAAYNELTLYRKGYNFEKHKGGQRIAVGDPADLCLLSWFAGSTQTAQCAAASCTGPVPFQCDYPTTK